MTKIYDTLETSPTLTIELQRRLRMFELTPGSFVARVRTKAQNKSVGSYKKLGQPLSE